MRCSRHKVIAPALQMQTNNGWAVGGGRTTCGRGGWRWCRTGMWFRFDCVWVCGVTAHGVASVWDRRRRRVDKNVTLSESLSLLLTCDPNKSHATPPPAPTPSSHRSRITSQASRCCCCRRRCRRCCRRCCVKTRSSGSGRERLAARKQAMGIYMCKIFVGI